MIENVKKLFKKTISTYEIAKETGLPEQTVRNLRNGISNMEEARYKNIKALSDYYLKRFSLKKFNTIEIDIDDIEEIEEIEYIPKSNEGEEVVISKLNGIIYSVHTEIDEVSLEDTEYFSTYDEAKRYADYISV